MALIKMMANDGTTEIVDIKVPVQYSVVPAVTGATVELATGATTVAITVDPDFASIADATASMTDGLNAAIEAGVCTLNDLSQFIDVLVIRETQGIKAAKTACRTLITEKGCRGLCIAAVNCYDLGI